MLLEPIQLINKHLNPIASDVFYSQNAFAVCAKASTNVRVGFPTPRGYFKGPPLVPNPTFWHMIRRLEIWLVNDSTCFPLKQQLRVLFMVQDGSFPELQSLRILLPDFFHMFPEDGDMTGKRGDLAEFIEQRQVKIKVKELAVVTTANHSPWETDYQEYHRRRVKAAITIED